MLPLNYDLYIVNMSTVTSLQTDKAIPWQTKLLHCRQVSIHRKHGQQMLLGPAKKATR